MAYEVTHGEESHRVDVRELEPDVYEVTVDEAAPIRVDARRTGPGSYSILLGAAQYEASVDEREGGVLDVHVGTSAFDFSVIDERRKVLVGSPPKAAVGKQTLRAQMPGKIVKLLVSVGDEVEVDQGLMVIEAMKMENELRSPVAGVVLEIAVAEGDAVDADALLCVVDPPGEESG